MSLRLAQILSDIAPALDNLLKKGMADAQTPRPRRIRRRTKPRRTRKQIQLMVETLFTQVENRRQYLQPDDPGYRAGEQTPDPNYWVLSDKERLDILNRYTSHLINLLPIREAEDKVAMLERQIEDLMSLIQQRAPFILQGGGGGYEPGLQ